MPLPCETWIKLLFRVVVIIAASTTALPAHAQSSPCNELLIADQENNVVGWAFSKLSNFFSKKKITSTAPASEPKFYFTKRPGQFASINCAETNYETQEIYPIGIVVQEVAELNLPNYHRGTPVLVRTEYGHRKVVPREDLEPIEADKVYIFADSYQKSYMCRDTSDCAGNTREICEDCKYDISAFWGYATTSIGRDDNTEVISAYRELYKDKLIMDAEGQLHPDDQGRLLEIACKPFWVTAWGQGGLRHQPKDVAFSFCGDISKQTLHGYKVVDLASLNERFKTPLWGSFHRNFGDPDSIFKEEIRKAIQLTPWETRKECGTSISKKDVRTLGGGIGVSWGIKDTANISLDAKQQRTTEFLDTVGKDVYLLYSVYFIRPLSFSGDEGDKSEDDLWILDITFKSTCDESNTPDKAVSISVFFNLLSDGYETLDARSDLKDKYTKHRLNFSYAENQTAAQLENGRFWYIADHIGYFNWRDTLREIMVSGMPKFQELLQHYPINERPLVRDFFVHLLMSAAFQYKEPEKYRRLSR